MKKLKRILDAGSKKQIRDEPMTPTEVREHAQPALLSVPTTPPAGAAPAAPVNQPIPRDGDRPADPDRTHTGKVEDVNVVEVTGAAGKTAADLLTTNEEGRVVQPSAPTPKKRRRGGPAVYVPPKEAASEPGPTPITRHPDDDYSPF